MLQTGKVAMDITGHWKILDLNQMGFDWGMGVLPYFKEPTTILCGAALGIFTVPKHQDEAFELFQALGDTATAMIYSVMVCGCHCMLKITPIQPRLVSG